MVDGYTIPLFASITPFECEVTANLGHLGIAGAS